MLACVSARGRRGWGGGSAVVIFAAEAGAAPTGRSGCGEQRREVAIDVGRVRRCGGALGGELSQGVQAVGSPALGDMGGGVAGEGRWRERPEGVEDLPSR